MPYDDDGKYQEFDPIVIGGTTGDYSVTAPMASSRWVEYNLINFATGDVVGATGFVVSGNSKPAQPNWVGTAGTAMDSDHVMHGVVVRMAASSSFSPFVEWIRVTNSEKKVFIRIDTQASDSAYVTLQFRARYIETVPGPAPTGHPDHPDEINKMRSETAKQRLSDLGIPGYAQEGTGVQTNKGQ